MNLTAILRSDDFFKRTEVPRSTATVDFDYTGIQHPAVFRMATLFLSNVAVKEIQKGHKPILTQWRNRATEYKNAFLNEMKRYARQQYPYNEPIEQDQSPMNWWKAINGREFAQILPVRTTKFVI